MKLISLALIAASFSTGVMAKTVNDKLATDLRAALVGAGAEAKIMVDASFVSVTSLKCSQEGGIVLLPLKCSFVNNGRLVESEGNKAQALATALTAAGVKSSSIREGEHTSFKVAAKSVDCSTMAIHRMISCEVK